MKPHSQRPHRLSFWVVPVMLTAIVFCFYACTDHGLNEDFFPTVEGTLQITGQVPDNTDEIVLALVQGATPRFTRTIPRSALNLDSTSQTVPFVMEVQPGEYDALFAIWKELGEPLSIFENLVGARCQDGEPVATVITEANPNISDVSVDVNLRKVNRTAGVTGVIRFTGTRPQNLENLALIFVDPAALAGISACAILQNVDIRLLPTAPADTIAFDYNIAAGQTAMTIAWNSEGESLLQPNISLSLSLIEAVAGETKTVEITGNFDSSIKVGGL